ncbi:MAG TPA: 50S ribosomal protein L18e [Candidatus Norongarragalinales archaeon]|jgi:ribosomal protein L18E|nr:50S ribosomal protein L18e [Candidatus Norongarragalinales archaeon]
MKRGPENPELKKVIHALEKAAVAHDAPVYERLAHLFRRPTRQRSEVNLNKVARLSNDGKTLATYKVLSLGKATKNINVAAFAYSKAAKAKIAHAGGHAISIPELLKTKPDGKDVQLLL